MTDCDILACEALSMNDHSLCNVLSTGNDVAANEELVVLGSWGFDGKIRRGAVGWYKVCQCK